MLEKWPVFHRHSASIKMPERMFCDLPRRPTPPQSRLSLLKEEETEVPTVGFIIGLTFLTFGENEKKQGYLPLKRVFCICSLAFLFFFFFSLREGRCLLEVFYFIPNVDLTSWRMCDFVKWYTGHSRVNSCQPWVSDWLAEYYVVSAVFASAVWWRTWWLDPEFVRFHST